MVITLLVWLCGSVKPIQRKLLHIFKHSQKIRGEFNYNRQYCSLADFVWASSAPTLAILDQFQYKELSGAVYRQMGGNACYNIIERGFAELEEMVRYDRTSYLSEMFNLCTYIDGTLDVQTFFSALSEFFSLLVQFDV